MNRVPAQMASLLGQQLWKDNSGNQLVDNAGNLLVFNATHSCFPFQLTVPPNDLSLVVDKRRSYSSSVTVTTAQQKNAVTSAANQFVDSSGNILIFNAAVSQNANPIVMTIPPSGTDVIPGE